MYQVGITGNIGAGKSLVGKIFAIFGIPVYDADSRAKWLMVNHPDLKKGIIKAFGTEAYSEDGQLNRAYLANIVFNDKQELTKLNNLVHGRVLQDSLEWAAQQKSPYVLREAALLIESGHYKNLDFLIVVAAPENIRIQRVIARDGSTEEAVRARMKNQLPQEEKKKKADFILNNDGKHSVLKQCWQLHQKLSKLAKAKEDSTLKT